MWRTKGGGLELPEFAAKRAEVCSRLDLSRTCFVLNIVFNGHNRLKTGSGHLARIEGLYYSHDRFRERLIPVFFASKVASCDF